ncbi:GyrI-like domain-containing protein [Metabacillus arenae]|uniref:GyrI-like domain-containing protein n=1 Tax=Metabacillus arenae TaxID=2771434 RepID=UPI001CD1815D|nr:GyrI-like domain-containing protein [Metabacillus arenae]
MKKYEWRKQDKDLYLPKSKPSIIKVESMKYLTLVGAGNPNCEPFKTAVEALYSLSYAIKMIHKKGNPPEGYFDYVVFPLEGVWDLDEEGRKLNYLEKDHLVYKLMIRQPDFLTEALFLSIVDDVKKKKPNPMHNKIKFEEIEEGLCLQMLHIGSYDEEERSFTQMAKYCEENGFTRVDKRHREIYISDLRKTDPAKLKTVLRIQVKTDE